MAIHRPALARSSVGSRRLRRLKFAPSSPVPAFGAWSRSIIPPSSAHDAAPTSCPTAPPDSRACCCAAGTTSMPVKSLSRSWAGMTGVSQTRGAPRSCSVGVPVRGGLDRAQETSRMLRGAGRGCGAPTSPFMIVLDPHHVVLQPAGQHRRAHRALLAPPPGRPPPRRWRDPFPCRRRHRRHDVDAPDADRGLAARVQAACRELLLSACGNCCASQRCMSRMSGYWRSSAGHGTAHGWLSPSRRRVTMLRPSYSSSRG